MTTKINFKSGDDIWQNCHVQIKCKVEKLLLVKKNTHVTFRYKYKQKAHVCKQTTTSYVVWLSYLHSRFVLNLFIIKWLVYHILGKRRRGSDPIPLLLLLEKDTQHQRLAKLFAQSADRHRLSYSFPCYMSWNTKKCHHKNQWQILHQNNF